MESELLKLLSHLPSPLAAVALGLLCVLLGVRVYDDLWNRRPFENANRERQFWLHEMSCYDKSLEMRRKYLGEPDPEFEAAVVSDLLARGQMFTLLGRKVREEEPPEPRFWSAESSHTWFPLRVLEVAMRISFGSWLCTMAAAVTGVIAADALSFKYPPFVGIATEAILQSQLVLIGLLMAASMIASIVRWVSGKDLGSELFEPPIDGKR